MRTMVLRSTFSGISGLPQSRPIENDQSRVAISPAAPASWARVIRWIIVSWSPVQYIWKNVVAPVAVTSSTDLEAKFDSPMILPRAAAARATATSPSGCTAWTPVGLMITGDAIWWPNTVVAWLRSGCWPTTWGARPSSANAAWLSATVWPRSEPATRAPYTGCGSRLRARS
jgi:hypothetical protein